MACSIRFLGTATAVAACALLGAARGAEKTDGKEAPAAKPVRARVKSTKDGKEQSVVFYRPSDAKVKRQGGKVPLLVNLHTWSSSLRIDKKVLKECQERGWAAIGPHYRGGNRRPEACASDLAVQDILDAVAWARKQVPVDEKRIYITGASGGGHMAMVMAHRAPKLWAGVSAWVGISDLFAWHKYCLARRAKYYKDMEASCGGPPGKSKEVDAEYRKRSPLFHLAAAKGLPMDINHGILDGAIPPSHSLRAFNVLAEANGHKDKQVTAEQMKSIDARKVPPELAKERADEPGRVHRILFRRQAGAARITIFRGGHSGDYPTAIRWLAEHKRKDLSGKSSRN